MSDDTAPSPLTARVTARLTDDDLKARYGLSVIEWANERFANSIHIASEKIGDDQESWFEDAAYWGHICVNLEDAEALRFRVQELEMDRVVPGRAVCDVCKFELTTTLISATTGQMGMPIAPTSEPCPNGCGPLRSKTWREDSDDSAKAWHRLHEMFTKSQEALQDAERRLREAEARAERFTRLGGLVDQVDMAVGPHGALIDFEHKLACGTNYWREAVETFIPALHKLRAALAADQRAALADPQAQGRETP